MCFVPLCQLLMHTLKLRVADLYHHWIVGVHVSSAQLLVLKSTDLCASCGDCDSTALPLPSRERVV